MGAERGTDAGGVVDAALLARCRVCGCRLLVAHARIAIALLGCGRARLLALFFLATDLPGKLALLEKRSVLISGNPALDDNLSGACTGISAME